MNNLETLKLALENAQPSFMCPGWTLVRNEDITALRQAIQQAEQAQPVAWRAPNWGHSDDQWVYRDFDDPVLIADGKPSPNNVPLYTAPPPRQPLTDEQISDLWCKVSNTDFVTADTHEFARAIEAAHQIGVKK